MMSEEARQLKLKVLETFKKGRELYLAGDYVGARGVFAEACRLDPQDGPSRLYWGRCKWLMENPPKPDWDGVWNVTEK